VVSGIEGTFGTLWFINNQKSKITDKKATIKKIHEWLFYLTENTLAAAPPDKTAKVKTRSTCTTDGMAARIVQERTEYRRETTVNIIRPASAAKLERGEFGELVVIINC
jgi:hypothetical protein